MPRRARLCLADIPTHVVQRRHDRRPVFLSDQDRLRYLAELKQQAGRHGVAVHAYVLMSNHVHLLVTPRDEHGVSRMMKGLGERYVFYFNRRHGRTGTLWESRPYSCLVDSERYLFTCHRYIECNPVRAGLVRDPGHYVWSSYRANALGAADAVLTPHPAVTALGRNARERQAAYRELFRSELEHESVDEIRVTTRGGFVLGGAEFQARMSAALGVPVTRRRLVQNRVRSPSPS